MVVSGTVRLSICDWMMMMTNTISFTFRTMHNIIMLFSVTKKQETPMTTPSIEVTTPTIDITTTTIMTPIDTGCAITDTDTCTVGRSPAIGQKYGYMDVNLAVDGFNDNVQEELLCQVC